MHDKWVAASHGNERSRLEYYRSLLIKLLVCCNVHYLSNINRLNIHLLRLPLSVVTFSSIDKCIGNPAMPVESRLVSLEEFLRTLRFRVPDSQHTSENALWLNRNQQAAVGRCRRCASG
jgi:hypothetical protein